MSVAVTRVDQLCVVISDPILQIRHFTVVEIKGAIINFSPEDLHIVGISFGGLTGKTNPSIPTTLPSHSSTGEIVLLTLEINRDDIDPIENMVVGSFRLQYQNSTGCMNLTAPALFQLLLQ